MTSLVKIDSGSKPTEPVQLTHSLPTATSGEPVGSPVVAVRTASVAVRVRRKPIPGTASSTTSPTSPPVQQQPFNSKATASQPTSPMSYPSQAAQNVTGQYSKPEHQPLPIPTPTPTPTGASGRTGEALASCPSGEQASIPHAGTELIVQTTSPVSPSSTQEPSQGFPQLQEVRTAPELTNIGAETYPSHVKRPRFRRSAHSQPISFSSIKRKHPATVNNIRRASHASVATAKKLSRNPWLRAGVKIGAKYALRQVIGDVAADLMVDNVTGGAINVASGLFSNNNNSSPTDLTSGLLNNNSSPTDLTSGLFTNNDSSSNLPDPGTILDNSNAYGSSIGGYSPPLIPAGPSLMYQAPGFTTPPNDNNLNATFFGQTQYSPTQNQFISSYGNGNNSLGGQDPMPQYNIAQQQLAAEQNVLYNQNMLDSELVNSGTQVSQMFCADEASNASAGLANAGNAV